MKMTSDDDIDQFNDFTLPTDPISAQPEND